VFPLLPFCPKRYYHTISDSGWTMGSSRRPPAAHIQAAKLQQPRRYRVLQCCHHPLHSPRMRWCPICPVRPGISHAPLPHADMQLVVGLLIAARQRRVNNPGIIIAIVPTRRVSILSDEAGQMALLSRSSRTSHYSSQKSTRTGGRSGTGQTCRGYMECDGNLDDGSGASASGVGVVGGSRTDHSWDGTGEADVMVVQRRVRSEFHF